MNNINNNKLKDNDIDKLDKIFIYKPNDCYLQNDNIYCDNIKKIYNNNLLINTINTKKVKENITPTEMEKILCYTY